MISCHLSFIFSTCVNGTIYCEEVPCRECNYGQVVSRCVCPRTCRNIHSLVCGDDDCEEGCQCPEGQVLDEWNERCVAPKNCPCVMDGTPYAVGVIRKYGSDLCICRAGSSWECASTVDEGSCWAYGISSFITFDNNVFNYDGSCSYMMATDGCSPNTNRTFSVMIESIDCAEGGAFCTKSVHIEFVDITIDLIRGADPKVRPPEACACVQDIGGRYTLVQHEGVAVQWDGRNMVIVTLKDEYMGRVCGLCGDFDGRSDDDFTKQQGDSTRDVNEFVESWATRECLPSSDMTPACVSEVEEKRRPWAEVMCKTILEGPFVECHQFVNPSRYYEHCVSDSIKCYRGSDCECLCDALAAYAQKCIEKGVCVNWRTEDLCRGRVLLRARHGGAKRNLHSSTNTTNVPWNHHPHMVPINEARNHNFTRHYNGTSSNYPSHHFPVSLESSSDRNTATGNSHIAACRHDFRQDYSTRDNRHERATCNNCDNNSGGVDIFRARNHNFACNYDGTSSNYPSHHFPVSLESSSDRNNATGNSHIAACRHDFRQDYSTRDNRHERATCNNCDNNSGGVDIFRARNHNFACNYDGTSSNYPSHLFPVSLESSSDRNNATGNSHIAACRHDFREDYSTRDNRHDRATCYNCSPSNQKDTSAGVYNFTSDFPVPYNGSNICSDYL
ncbi:mucin-2-like [Diadema setosum]|uniref:mucin-2-like n=1 Tax=Diadema setosum TaxID=31175 RepID=UPI003B3B5516